ncbi:MAG: sialate O-acetylesterase [Phycisphaeraceae bacterium]
MKHLLYVLALLCLALPAIKTRGDDIALGLPFRDNMVLQRGIELPVWGIATPGASIRVDYDGQRKTATADEDGNWRVKLDPLRAAKLESPSQVPEGTTLTVTAEHNGEQRSMKLSNLVVGDVWLCGGQSNIAGKLKGSGTYQGERADYPGFRHFTPTDGGGWTVCTPDREGAGEFKRTAFYFGRDVYKQSLIPIGLVTTAVGGSNIESWLNREPYETGKNYTNLVEPIVGLGIRGVVWYQGESNANKATPYRPLLTSLIKGWRAAWGQGDLPFYYVQLPGYGERTNQLGDKRVGWPPLRQAQLETLSIDKTGMAVTIDIGHKSIHPPNKVDTGKRLARLALHHDYGFDDLVPTGPLYASHVIDGRSVRVQFKYGEGLMLADKQGIDPPMPSEQTKLQSVWLQDEAGDWHAGEGVIEGEELVIRSKGVTRPVAARYAYVPHPAGPLLYNKDGLPASPFETPETGE